MKAVKGHELVKGYLQRHRWTILLIGALLLLPLLVYSLYGLPWGPAVYTVLLMGAVSLAVGLLGFREYAKKAVRLAAAQKEAELHLGELPPAWDLTEGYYRQIAQTLERRCLESEHQKEQSLKDASRYYLLWSHQVKTPLAAMRLLLQEEQLDRRGLEQELFKTEQYVEMALQYQRLGCGFDDLMLRELDLERLCKEALKRTAPLFIHKRIKVQLGNLSCRVLTDEKGLCFVLEQILTNAVKYTREGGLVTLSLAEEEPATLVISDNGIGILPEDLPRVFDWGFTGYNGRLETRSTGIGLALCRQTMSLLGHTIRISSALGEGTQVFLGLGRDKLPIE